MANGDERLNINQVPIFNVTTELRHLERLTKLAEERDNLHHENQQLKAEIGYLKHKIASMSIQKDD